MRTSRRLTPLLYVLALALRLPLRLAAANPGEYGSGELVAACVSIMLLALVLFGILSVPWRSTVRFEKGAVLTLLALVWLFLAPLAEQSLLDMAAESSVVGKFARYRLVVLLTWTLSATAVLYVVRRHSVNHLLNRAGAICALLLLFTIVDLVKKQAFAPIRPPSVVSRNALSLPASPQAVATDPDFYIFILDQYANEQVLRDYFGYSNREFTSFLRQRGFDIPEDVHSNYAWTALSLSSLLNATYLNSPRHESERPDDEFADLYSSIQSNAVVAALKKRGYRYYLAPSRQFPGTLRSAIADSVISVQGAGFRGTLMQRPLIFNLMTENSVGRVLGKLGVSFGAYNYEAALARGIRTVITRPERKVVLAHLMLTHEPYLVDGQCRQHYALRPSDRDTVSYVAGLSCTNLLLRGLIESILAGSRRSAVIILQGDHGTKTTLRPGPASLASTTTMHERFGAFGAYLLPRGVAPMPDTVSLVNVFPVVFSRVFGSRERLLPDHQYFSTLSRPLSFVEYHAGSTSVTDSGAVVSKGAGVGGDELPRIRASVQF